MWLSGLLCSDKRLSSRKRVARNYRLSESSGHTRPGLRDACGHRRLVNLHVSARARTRVRPALVEASEEKKRLGLTRMRQGRQLVAVGSPSSSSDGWRRTSTVDFGDGTLIPKKQASE